jgi:hypothetical protein
MDLRQLLRKDFDIDFPISGGFGNSRDNAIHIDRQYPNDYTSVEYGILKCLGNGRNVEWKLIQQSTLHHHGRTLDQLKIETRETTEDEIVTQIENYYFDISECINF